MKITTQAQADAVQKKLDALKEWDYAFESQNKNPEIAHLEAALADWNERKEIEGIVLTPCEEARLRLLSFSVEEQREAYYSLRKKAFEDGYASSPTPKGRAYLEAQKPRELRWEVWCKDGKWIKLGSFDRKMEAEIFYEARVHRLARTVYCEVREVKP